MQPTPPSQEDAWLASSRLIRRKLVQMSEAAYTRHPFLTRHDLIGGTVLTLSTLAVVLGALGYAYGVLPAWAVILHAAFAISFVHDIEHDLLHRLYFQRNRFLYNAAMLLVWLLRPGSINPWVRRDWHMHHHRASGTPSDIEERGLLNGERWGLRRAIMSFEGLLAVILRPRTVVGMLNAYAATHKPSEQRRAWRRSFNAYFPLGHLHAICLYWFLGLHATSWGYSVLGIPHHLSSVNATMLPILNFVAVTLLLPNTLRTACLYFVSSNMHYYGDIDPKYIVQQGQVWDAWWLFPLQMFCCDFGRTHLIHHFAVQYPFYMRLWIAKDALRVMRANGVRFNDFGAMRRANRYHIPAATDTLGHSASASQAA